MIRFEYHPILGLVWWTIEKKPKHTKSKKRRNGKR